MKQYEALLEDENDIFGGTPKTKFWDIFTTSHDDISKEFLDEIVKNYAILEHIVKQSIIEDKLDEYLKFYYDQHQEEIDEDKKSVYLEFVGNILYKMPQ